MRAVPQRVDKFVVAGPAVRLRQHDQEQQGGVDAAVVGEGAALGGDPAHPQLVHDLARLGVAHIVALPGLQRGQRLQRAHRQRRAQRQRLVGGDQRVAAEHGHEPGQPGRRQVAQRPVALAGAHPQRGQVGDRPGEGVPQILRAGLQLGHAELPGAQRLADPLALVAEVEAGVAGLPLLVAVQQHDVAAALPAGAGSQLQTVADRPLVRLALARRPDQRLGLEAAVVQGERPRVLALIVVTADVDRRLRGVGEHQLLLVVRPRLDLEQVEEVDVELHLQLQRHRVDQVVLDPQALLHAALADEHVADQRDRARGEALGARVLHEHGGRVVVDGARAEQLRLVAVDQQPPLRQVAGVVEVEAVRSAPDLAVVVGDEKRVSLEDGQHGADASRGAPGLPPGRPAEGPVRRLRPPCGCRARAPRSAPPWGGRRARRTRPRRPS